jgi:hypothetical protein
MIKVLNNTLNNSESEKYFSKEAKVGDLLVFDTNSEQRKADISLVIFVSKQKVIYFNLECEHEVFECVFDKLSSAKKDEWYSSVRAYAEFAPLFKTCGPVRCVISPHG